MLIGKTTSFAASKLFSAFFPVIVKKTRLSRIEFMTVTISQVPWAFFHSQLLMIFNTRWRKWEMRPLLANYVYLCHFNGTQQELDCCSEAFNSWGGFVRCAGDSQRDNNVSLTCWTDLNDHIISPCSYKLQAWARNATSWCPDLKHSYLDLKHSCLDPAYHLQCHVAAKCDSKLASYPLHSFTMSTTSLATRG